MKVFGPLTLAAALAMPYGIVAANNDDGFVWIDANTRIKVKPVSTTGGTGASAPDTGTRAPEKLPKKTGKKETAK